MLYSMKMKTLKTKSVFEEAQQFNEICGVLQNKVSNLC